MRTLLNDTKLFNQYEISHPDEIENKKAFHGAGRSTQTDTDKGRQ